MKKPFTSVIGIDFVNSDGSRVTAFQLCGTKSDGRLESQATVDFTDNLITRYAVIPSLAARMAAIFRLANIHRNRSVPQVFGSDAITA